MVKVVCTKDGRRETKVYNEHVTIREILNDVNFSFNTGITSINGATISNADLAKELNSFATDDIVYITNVAKAANA